ncbi:hypothetical protein PCA20602_04854 [Pandoraea capi]|uniref:Uncharacterized protein n=1 Tax=Pandoraea capi TaxID=2508286 RepID=A0ABY6WBT5_9BURK|nr:hypothetical protein [Pandoraea capi]VVE53248.1 hypothetical protein PCA20602_04854 [Pandoraea capi]
MTNHRIGQVPGNEMRRQTLATTFAAALLAMASSLAVAADNAPRVDSATSASSRAGCVDVEVNGQRSPSYDCLTNQLQPASAPGAGRKPGLESEDIANKPGNQIGGQFNWSGTSQRMGNTFGSSATPQRPDAAPPAAPVVRPGR